MNAQAVKVVSGSITKSENLERDKKDLADLYARYLNAKKALEDYNNEKLKGVSTEGRDKARVNILNQENALIKEQLAQRERLNAAIQKGSEYNSQAQAAKARLSNTGEGAVQRQLNSDYKEMLKIIKEYGEVRAKAASEGRNMNQQEYALVQTLIDRYRIFKDDINRVASSYANIAQASAQAFQNDKSAQLSRNAVLIADANNKAAEAAQKVADANAKAEAKAIAAGEKIIAQKEAQIAKQEAADKKAADNYEKWWLSALDKREKAESVANARQEANDRRAAQNYEKWWEQSIKKILSEYKSLIAERDSLQKTFNNYFASGHTFPTDTTRGIGRDFETIENRIIAINNRIAEITRMGVAGIKEIADYSDKMLIESSQRSLSAFVQAEAQKTAEAKKQADERARMQAESLNKYLNSAQGAMWYSRQLNKGNIDNSYENRERAIKQLENAIKSLDSNDKNYDKTLQQLTRTLNTLKQAQNEVNNAMKPTKPMVSPQDAINAAKNATSLKQLKDAYKQLKEVMDSTNPKSQDWTNMNTQLKQTKTHIDEIKKKMGEFQSRSAKTSNILGQLQGRIAAAFSVGAISGFIKKMVEVRAQFELQRVALGAIIQDRDEANKIFTQVQNMALESPFNIMQLEKATKQIAAFGFETKKLVPTMKMFADISAGLGVEIDRLVLVMGHLKARNFLEGTMVRQFTNMGFNVLGELSKYYTELEGKMVSVGEVQDRVKKKMISFEDVEEVLKRVTSAGGMFYDMQKKQSDSLWGQMQRIQDAYDLMLNEIGQSNEGILKSALSTIRSLISNWRALKPAIVATVAAMGAFGAAMFFMRGLPALISSVKNGIFMMKVALLDAASAQKTLYAAQTANVWGALLAAIVAVIAAVSQYISTQDRLTEAMDRVRSEGIGNMYELITQYR